MGSTSDVVWIDDLDVDVCWRLVANAVIGRIGFVDGDDPVVLPVNYAVEDRTIVFRTAQTSMLESLAGGAKVAFELDGTDPFAETGWSVLVRGLAEEVVPSQHPALDRLALRPWAPGLRDHWIRIRPVTVTGRAISHGAGPAADPCQRVATGVE